MGHDGINNDGINNNGIHNDDPTLIKIREDIKRCRSNIKTLIDKGVNFRWSAVTDNADRLAFIKSVSRKCDLLTASCFTVVISRSCTLEKLLGTIAEMNIKIKRIDSISLANKILDDIGILEYEEDKK